MFFLQRVSFIGDGALGGTGGLGGSPSPNGTAGTGVVGGLYIEGGLVVIVVATFACNEATTNNPDVYGTYLV